MLPISRIEALELPIAVRRTTQKPHADMIYYKYVINTTCLWIYHSTRHLLSASFLTPNEIFQVSTSRERASSKRFSYVCFPPTEPRWLLRTVSDANLVKYIGLNNNRLKGWGKRAGAKGLGQKDEAIRTTY